MVCYKFIPKILTFRKIMFLVDLSYQDEIIQGNAFSHLRGWNTFDKMPNNMPRQNNSLNITNADRRCQRFSGCCKDSLQ